MAAFFLGRWSVAQPVDSAEPLALVEPVGPRDASKAIALGEPVEPNPSPTPVDAGEPVDAMEQGRPADAGQPLGLPAEAAASSRDAGTRTEPLEAREGRPRGRFGIQVAAFPSRVELEVFLETHAEALRVFGTTVYLERRRIEGQTWLRVRVGSFPTAGTADAARARLGPLGEGAMVTRYR